MRTPGNANGQEDVITHPLLSNNPGSQATGGSSILRNSLNDSMPRRGHGAGFSNWQEFEDIIGGSTVRMLESILANAPSGSHGSHVRVDISNGPSGVFRSAEFERPPNPQASRSEGASSTANDDIQKGLALLHDFQPMTTGERWNQEARMMYGTNLGEKALKVVNTMLNILVPVSIEEGKEEKWRLEKEARQAVLEAIAQPQESTEAVQEEEQEEEQEQEQPDNNTQEAEASSNAMDTADTGAEPTENATEERTTVVIHGEHIDISGTGIDVEFLEALPDDLREEVINQHMRNRPQPSLPAEDDSISPEFLDALPADIREEVLNHEAIERERRDRQNRQATQSSSNLANSANAITSTGMQ